jgi:hypothetical protein
MAGNVTNTADKPNSNIARFTRSLLVGPDSLQAMMLDRSVASKQDNANVSC